LISFFQHLDQQAFLIINQSLRNPVFDFIMPCLRDKYFWIPLYALLVVCVIVKYRWHGMIVMILAALTVVLTDQLASSVIKPWVQRLRPCNDALFSPQVHLLVDCGPGFSFVSSHAANHFGLAVFLIFLFGRQWNWFAPAALVWAASVAFAQVYVGLHYPFDAAAGALLGAAIGFFTGRVCLYALRRYGYRAT
jgi:undecaprenyl-diphosphatase